MPEEPSKYVQTEAKRLIGENVMFKTFSYSNDRFVYIIGRYNNEKKLLSTWGMGPTWGQALRIARKVAITNGWVGKDYEQNNNQTTE